MPSAFAALRFDDELELGRLLDGQVGRLGALENLVDIDRGAPELIGNAGSIGDEAARACEFSKLSPSADLILITSLHALDCSTGNLPIAYLEILSKLSCHAVIAMRLPSLPADARTRQWKTRLRLDTLTYGCTNDTLWCMRTTVRLDDHLLAEAKKIAAESGRTLASVLEDALREALARRTVREKRARVRLKTVGGDGIRSGVDLDDTAALLDLIES